MTTIPPQATDPPQTTVPTQTTGTALVCEEPPPAEIALGSTITSEIDDPIWTRCFWVEVPEGIDSITIELTDLAADLNLSAGFGFLVTLQYNMGEFWQSVEGGTAEEVVFIENPEPGPYYIKVGIAGPREPTPFTLSALTAPAMTAPTTGAMLPSAETCAPPAMDIGLGTTITSEIVGREEAPEPRRYFCVQVPDGLSSITIELAELKADLDLFVRLSTPAMWTDRRRGIPERVVVIENPEPGPYYIDVAGAFVGAASPFTLHVRSP
jgi:hypothetical protein